MFVWLSMTPSLVVRIDPGKALSDNVDYTELNEPEVRHIIRWVPAYCWKGTPKGLLYARRGLWDILSFSTGKVCHPEASSGYICDM